MTYEPSVGINHWLHVQKPGAAGNGAHPHQLRQREPRPGEAQRAAGVSADYLFHAYADRPEGDLTRIRASLVSEGALFQFAQEIHLGEYLRLGRGEERCGGRTRPSVVSDAFEAVIAALYLDGGMEVARNFILPFITEGKHAEADYKTRLQEIVQQNPEERLSYVVESESGPDHDKHFVVAVRFNSDRVARGEGRSKKAAEQHAAKEALKLLGVIKEK